LTTLRSAVRTAYSLTTLNWITAFFMIAFHGLAIAAFFWFSWTNVFVALALHWMAVGFGISLGYHRLHTHRGFRTSKAFEYFRSSGSPRTGATTNCRIRRAIRTARATAASGRTWAGSSSATRTTTTPR
jgi:fatty-acid desaturase